MRDNNVEYKLIGYLEALQDVQNFLESKGVHINGLIDLYDEYRKHEQPISTK